MYPRRETGQSCFTVAIFHRTWQHGCRRRPVEVHAHCPREAGPPNRGLGSSAQLSSSNMNPRRLRHATRRRQTCPLGPHNTWAYLERVVPGRTSWKLSRQSPSDDPGRMRHPRKESVETSTLSQPVRPAAPQSRLSLCPWCKYTLTLRYSTQSTQTCRWGDDQGTGGVVVSQTLPSSKIAVKQAGGGP